MNRGEEPYEMRTKRALGGKQVKMESSLMEVRAAPRNQGGKWGSMGSGAIPGEWGRGLRKKKRDAIKSSCLTVSGKGVSVREHPSQKYKKKNGKQSLISNMSC